MCQSALGEDTFNGVVVERQQKVLETDSFSSGISGNTIFVGGFSFFLLRQCVSSETTDSLHLLSIYARWQVGILISPNYEQ